MPKQHPSPAAVRVFEFASERPLFTRFSGPIGAANADKFFIGQIYEKTVLPLYFGPDNRLYHPTKGSAKRRLDGISAQYDRMCEIYHVYEITGTEGTNVMAERVVQFL